MAVTAQRRNGATAQRLLVATRFAIGVRCISRDIVGVSFERLRVYQAAELFVQLIDELIPSIGGGHSRDVDQLKRAAPSLPYNIAEAFGSEHLGQKIYHLGIARGSVDESRAVLRKLAKAGALRPASIHRPSALAVTIAKMLTAWIESLQEKQRMQ